MLGQNDQKHHQLIQPSLTMIEPTSRIPTYSNHLEDPWRHDPRSKHAFACWICVLVVPGRLPDALRSVPKHFRDPAPIDS
jgi:hypothetical protein